MERVEHRVNKAWGNKMKLEAKNRDEALDELDYRILRVLQRDASINNLKLAEQVHSSPATCLRRVKSLEKRGVIQKQVAIVNPTILGSSLKVILEITLEKQASDYIETLERLLIREKQVMQCYRVSASVDLVAILQLKQMEDYHDFVHRVLNSHNNIRNVRALFVTHESKFETQLPFI